MSGDVVEPSAHSEAARAHVAWLLWCANQGYLKAEDRAILGGNHFLEDPQTLHQRDRDERPGWLQMADEVLATVRAEQDAELLAFGRWCLDNIGEDPAEYFGQKAELYGLDDADQPAEMLRRFRAGRPAVDRKWWGR